MFGFDVPIISTVIGEGSSSGALAIGCANYSFIMENAVYYVASPEACAAILWKSREQVAAVIALAFTMTNCILPLQACYGNYKRTALSTPTP